jgi:hypothetical protein
MCQVDKLLSDEAAAMSVLLRLLWTSAWKHVMCIVVLWFYLRCVQSYIDHHRKRYGCPGLQHLLLRLDANQ